MLDRAPNLPAPIGVDVCYAVLAYDGLGRDLVARLKYRNARTSVQWIVLQMAMLLDPDCTEVITWVPTTTARRLDRGYDQAQLLARGLSRQLRRPCRPLLERAHGPPQTGRTGVERLAGPSLAVRPGVRRRPPRSVVLVDDVITTGTTITIAARELRASGVERILGLAAARTPLKRVRTMAGPTAVNPEVRRNDLF
jgi:predicted amidophosphoribosyltransferase